MVKKSYEKNAYTKYARNISGISGKFININLYIILYVVTTSDSILSIHSYGYIVSIFKMMYE